MTTSRVAGTTAGAEARRPSVDPHLRVPVTGPSWWEHAACRGIDTRLFFPAGQNEESLHQTAGAKTVCRSCPAREACLEYALATHQAGIFGGTTEEERRSIRRRRKAGTALG